MAVETSTWATKKGLAQMLKGGVIMDVVTPDQAKIAEDAGAVAVMALERVPADIRAAGGVARMSDPSMIEGIMNAVTIPVMAKARIGHFVEAVRQLRDVLSGIRRLQGMREDELFTAAKELQAPYELVKQVAADGKLPVVNFVAGGISTPADAALVMQLGSEGVFVGSGIFKSEDPARMANAIVQATTHFDNPAIIADVSKGLGAPMRGIAMEAIPEQERLAVRGW